MVTEHTVRSYDEELKLVEVLKTNTDPVKFADRIYADVLA